MSKIYKELKPHTTDLRALQKASEVYAQGKTPEIHTDGRVTELNAKPGSPQLAASHLLEIHKSFGDRGVQQTVTGLQITRGNQFVLQMMEGRSNIKGLIDGTMMSENSKGVPVAVKNVLNSNNSGNPLPPDVQSLAHQITDNKPTNVRIYDNTDTHTAADSIGAKAFTVGQRIFFGKGQYNPHTNQGRDLLAHEIAHTYQQGMSPIPSVGTLAISSPKDRYERQADRFAKSVVKADQNRIGNDGEVTDDESVLGVEPIKSDSLAIARIQRRISFTTADVTPTTNPIGANRNAAGFRFQSATPMFQWAPQVTIHGNAGDNFADWETSHHQVVKGFWLNIYWGTGANRTRRRYFIRGGFPQRDVAQTAANTWYSDWRAQGFAANGNSRNPVFRDTPTIGRHPWNNPMPGRVGNSGWFNHGIGFVATLSVRHTPDGTGANAFRHLSHYHWNFGIAGNFDASQPMASRVSITTGGPINYGGPYSGFDPNNRPIHGGGVAIANLRQQDT